MIASPARRPPCSLRDAVCVVFPLRPHPNTNYVELQCQDWTLDKGKSPGRKALHRSPVVVTTQSLYPRKCRAVLSGPSNFLAVRICEERGQTLNPTYSDKRSGTGASLTYRPPRGQRGRPLSSEQTESVPVACGGRWVPVSC